MTQFNTRSDNAALKLRQELSGKGAEISESASVPVGPDGQPPAPPPPPGSYARQALDRQREQARAEQAEVASRAQRDMQQIGDQPPVGTPEQQADGSVAPPLTNGQGQPAAPEQSHPPISENANRRIQDLIAQNRDLERRLAEAAGSAGQLEELKGRLQQLEKERATFMERHLEELDPETRAQIMAEARMREIIAQNNQELLAALQPQLSTLHQQSQQTEYERLAARYPGFDLVIHKPLIEQVRAKNPGLTVEMAFKAVAEGDEAVPREQVARAAVPPVVPAGGGEPIPRYVPEPTSNPEDELVEFQRRTNKLLASQDPLERRQGLRDVDRVLSERLKGASYEGKPSPF